MKPHTRYLVVAMSTVALVISIGTVWMTHTVACTIVTAQRAAYASAEPTTPVGRNTRETWNTLYRRLYC